MDSFRKQLDVLMGANRNGDVAEVDRKYFDRDVCRLFLSGLCPHELFQLTKMDMGPCPKVHSLQLRKEYEEAKAKGTDNYDRDLEDVIDRLIVECDRKIARALKRLDDEDAKAAIAISVSEVTQTPEIVEMSKEIKEKLKEADLHDLEGKTDLKIRALEVVEELRTKRADKQSMLLLDAFNKDRASLPQPLTNAPQAATAAASAPPDPRIQEMINEKLKKAEDLGEQGMIDEAQKALDEAEALKKLPTRQEPVADSSKYTAADVRITDQKLRVCDICGAFLSVYDSDRRLADHFGGKLHLGYMQIREKLAELQLVGAIHALGPQFRWALKRETRSEKSMKKKGDQKSVEVMIANQVEIGNMETVVKEAGIVIRGAGIVIGIMTVIVPIGKEIVLTAMIQGVAVDHVHDQESALEIMIATGVLTDISFMRLRVPPLLVGYYCKGGTFLVSKIIRMREGDASRNGAKALKFADQNQVPNRGFSSKNNVKGANNGNLSKVKSSWGSQIVKGFSGEKKGKQQTVSQSKQVPLTSSNVANQKIPFGLTQSRAKRSLMGDLSCTVSGAQVHPHTFNAKKSSPGSRDLFLELDNLRSLLQESKDREFKLQAELSECKRNPKVFELERELELKRGEIDRVVEKVRLLESQNLSLAEQLASLNSSSGRENEVPKREVCENLSSVEMEVVELRRLNKELQLQKRNLACRLSSLESQIATSPKVSEIDIVEKIKEEASLLRYTNQDLCKQVEGLQLSRLNEVEEVAYLRWVNSCLRNELRNCQNSKFDTESSPQVTERPRDSVGLSSHGSDNSSQGSNLRLSLVKKLKKWPITDEDMRQLEFNDDFSNHSWDDSQNPVRRHSISGFKFCSENFMLDKRRQSDGFICFKEGEKEVQSLDSQKYNPRVTQRSEFLSGSQEACTVTASLAVEKRALRIPNPPPRPSCSAPSTEQAQIPSQIPPPPPVPPPPPPPPKLLGGNMTGKVKRAPQVVEFYHSLMKRDTRKDSLNGGTCDASDVANVRSNMIGEIENRSSYLLAIKADVETQGEFVNSLIEEVNNAMYQNIEDVVSFVKWLDDELCFLVDERAVLKHFEWPEKKADTLREAAFGYRDLKNLQHEIEHYRDDPHLSCDAALRKLVSLSEKMERMVYNLLGMRDLLIRRCKEFQIPTDWMHDNGILSKIKFASVKLAKMYMKRVALELQSKGTSEKDSSLDYMLLQGVRFAFRIHQFAGGFDAETMHAFEELRKLSRVE
ncbi:OLC1v1025723C1 [Oldenlandia corymbosa var. corymbosa]|uniref:OLC1v1025723C1 n=2 Tax=Magnoliopsida TaxID=3398 RepID=A0AAV1C7I9_OLDCO|nr:OLC1v1025723C1 [Oldenlandia corymbosa var. corymbosa]